jgi:hypothetical protein
MNEKETTTNIVAAEGYTISKGTLYIGVNEFLWVVVIMTGLFGSIMKVMWSSIQKQMEDSNESDKDIYNKLDEDRKELKSDIGKLDTRLWELKK